MKANFALTLSFTGIRLLHRAAGGWRFVGDVALDDPDLDGALAALRKTALELEPSGLRTKLALPGTQVRYLTIDTDGKPVDRLRAAAKAALDGATPYAVKDLIFDLSPDGDKTHIAAAARETLAEAESFAIKHRLAPISVVAIPQTEDFLGEPFFGATAHAAELLGPDEHVEPDGVAVVELGALEWPEGPVVDVDEAKPVAGTESPESTDPVPLDIAVDSDEPKDDSARDDSDPLPDHPATVDVSGPLPTHPDGALDETAEDDTTAPGSTPDAPARPGVGFASRRGPGAGGAPRLDGVSRRFEPAPPTSSESEEPASPPAEGRAPATDAQEGRGAPPVIDASPVEDDVPDPPPAALAAFLSRRQMQAESDNGPPAQPQEPDPPKTGGKAKGQPRSGARPEPESVAETPKLPPMAEAARQASPEIRPVRVPRPQSERQRMTVFGARQPEADGAAVVGGKPRFLGLILTAMLLLFLAGVAAWAAVFVEDGLARFFAPREPEAPIAAEEMAPEAASEPEPEPESAETEEPAPAQAEDLQTAALDTDLQQLVPEVEPEALAEPAPPPVFDPVEAEADYAVTGIWTVPPEVPEAPGLVNLDDLYMTSIDPANLSFDAVALQPEPEERTDRAPLAPASPAPPGTEFDLDERGLVTPTPDGAMSPDGILVHAGPPPVVPPDTPDRAEEVPEDVGAAARLELKEFRPRTRPDDLVENTERQRLGGLSRTELAGYRPKLRPESVKKAEEEDETPTAQAVASSLRPSNRPGNFERVVARAERADISPESTQEVASVAPRAVAPSIPSRSSVTKEATVRNAVNLRRINLMGVYGSPSNRRALVRLSNGSYKKVKVGDRIDGGRVSAIGDSELSYVKGNRNYVLKMPRT